jgi:hypothetical protein
MIKDNKLYLPIIIKIDFKLIKIAFKLNILHLRMIKNRIKKTEW